MYAQMPIISRSNLNLIGMNKNTYITDISDLIIE